jgi:uncharacterized membrane protein YwzB
MSLFISLAPKIAKNRVKKTICFTKIFFREANGFVKNKKLVYTNLFAINIQQFERYFSSSFYASYLQQSTYLRFFDFRHDEFYLQKTASSLRHKVALIKASMLS